MFKRKSLFFLVTAIHRFLSHFPTEIFWGFAGGYRKGRGDATAQFPPNLCACHGHGPPEKKTWKTATNVEIQVPAEKMQQGRAKKGEI